MRLIFIKKIVVLHLIQYLFLLKFMFIYLKLYNNQHNRKEIDDINLKNPMYSMKIQNCDET